MGVNCQNCEQATTGNYCNNCGQVRELRKIDRKYVTQEFLSVVGLEKGFLFTCKELLIKPAQIIREYINENRQKITKPITFLVLTSVIYTLISRFFKTDITYNELSKEIYGDSSIADIMNWVQNNYGYANLIMILPITLWTKFLFRKYRYNFYETFVMYAHSFVRVRT